MNSTRKLHEALVKIAPITGVAVVDPNDRTTWKIHFADSATSQQRSAAQAVLLAYVEAEDEVRLTAEDLVKLLRNKNILTEKDITDARAAKKAHP